MNNPPVLGIHLGVKHSNMATYKEGGEIEIIPTDAGKRSLDNYIEFTDTMLYVGSSAKNQEINNLENTVYDVKRMIDRNYEDMSALSDLCEWPFKVVQGENNKPKVLVRYKGEPATFYPEDLLSILFIKMLLESERHLGQKSRDAVIALPPYFSERQREVIRHAAAVSGLGVIQFIAEPLAAAIAYDLDKQVMWVRHILVFHLGGGTLVVSVLVTAEGGGLEVKSTSGDICLGGEYIDTILVHYFTKEFQRKFNQNLGVNKWAVRRLRNACEQAKHRLSYSKISNIEIKSLLNKIDFKTYLTRTKFEELTDNFFTIAMEHVDIALREANLTTSQISDVVLVGGSTRIPKVKELLGRKFLGRQMYTSIPPEFTIPHGAAMLASSIFRGHYRVEDQFILNAVPLSLGIETNGGVMSVVVQHDTPIPAKITKVFTTSLDNQVGVYFRIYEGERAIADNNLFLGNLYLCGIPPSPRGRPKIEVTFEMDTKGLLTVSAFEKSNVGGKKENKVQTKGRSIAKEDVMRTIKEAKHIFGLDEIRRTNAMARGRLVAYCTGVIAATKDARENMSRPDQNYVDHILKLCNEVIMWANTEIGGDRVQFEDYLETVKHMCTSVPAILSKLGAKPKMIYMGLPEEEVVVKGGDNECGDADRGAAGLKRPL